MKKTFALILTAVILNLVHAQSLGNGINQLKNENFIKAKQELLSCYKVDNSTLTAFYLGNVYMRLASMDSAYYYYQKAEAATDAFGFLAKARLALMDNKDSNFVRTITEKAITVSKRKSAEVFFQAGYLTFHPKAVSLHQSIQYIREAINMDPNNIYYGLTLGDLYLELKMTDKNMGVYGGKAMTQYEEVLAKDPNNALTNIRIGRLWYASKNYETAIGFLEKANSIDPSFSIAHKELGELYYLTKQYDKAAAEFKIYIQQNDNDSRAKVTYGLFLFQAKEYQKAVDEMNMFLANDSTNHIYYRIVAFSNYEVKKQKDAQLAMNKFWTYVGTNKITGLDYSYAGRIAAANGDTSNAIKYFKTSVLMDSTDADLQSEYAKALFNAKRNKEAIAEYKKRMLMEKAPLSLDYYYLGRAYYANGEFIMADTTFAEFVRLQPKSPDGYLWRAKSNLELEDKEHLKGLSVGYYQKYIELASTDLVRNKVNLVFAYNYLAYVALAAKDQEKAKEYFGKILEIEPGNENASQELSKLNKNKG